MELEMVIPSQKDVDLLDYYTPTGLEEDLWKESLIMMREFVEYIKNIDDTKKQVILQHTNFSISDHVTGAGAGIKAWDGKYVVDCSKMIDEGVYENEVVGYAKTAKEAVKLMYIAFGRSAWC